MKQSLLFTKTRREDPKDEMAKNAKLLIRGGYIHKEMAGVYSLLPLGLLVLNKITQIIREEMNKIGGVELQLTALQDEAIWEKTGRISDEVVDNWFKTQLKNETVVPLAFTHEEPITRLMTDHIQSYRDLPVYAYQFQTKFRNEARAKSGILRGREFLMKDLYCFVADEEALEKFYDEVALAYEAIYRRVGIGAVTHKTFASGGVFSKYSHEFQTVTEAGEDLIYIDEATGITINKEVLNPEVLTDLGLNKNSLVEKKAIEVGNIFKLGTRFSEALNLFYLDESGKKQPVIMGSFGIGVGRLLGAVVEVLADDYGIAWPKEIAPFDAHLLALGNSEAVQKEAEKIYQKLEKLGLTVLYDDRAVSAGEKLADADLLGMPFRLVVSDKTLAEAKIEVKERSTGKVEKLDLLELISKLKNQQ